MLCEARASAHEKTGDTPGVAVGSGRWSIQQRAEATLLELSTVLEPAASPGSHHADLIDGLFLLIQVGCVLTLLATNVSDSIWSCRFRVRSSWSAANLCSLQTELLLREFIGSPNPV